MNGDIANLTRKVDELEANHGKMSIFLEAFDKREQSAIANTRKAIHKLIGALGRHIPGARLTADEQREIKNSLAKDNTPNPSRRPGVKR